ncbi:hypothetical protein D3C73_1033020 [compost metagenome]
MARRTTDHNICSRYNRIRFYPFFDVTHYAWSSIRSLMGSHGRGIVINRQDALKATAKAMVCKSKCHPPCPGKKVNEAVFFLLHVELYIIFNHRHRSIRFWRKEC